MQYGQTNTTAPAGALTPLNPVQQPAGEPAIPTAAPKPVDPVVQAKLDAYAAEERRKQEAHENNQRRLDAEHEAKLNKQVAAAKPKTTSKEPVVAKTITSPAEIPSTDVASRQATQPMVEAGTIKPGKAGGSTNVLDQAILNSQPVIETQKQLEAKGTLFGTESWLKGTFGGKKNPERATTLIENLKSSLPEGEKLAFPIGPDGKSQGGMPSRDHVLKFTNDLLGTSMDSKAFKDFRFTEENLTKMHDTLLEKIKNAPSAEAAAKLEKGFATLSAMAATAGVALGGLALYSAYKKAKEGQYGEAAKIGVPAAAGLVNPAAGGLTEAAVNPSGAAQQLRGVAPIIGTFADIANQKMQQYFNKPKGAVPPPR
jgi:hypothetical protein